jgi:Uma2 family endonuclease
VVEVVSPGDNSQALDVKIAEYFRAGVGLVWVVHPATGSVRAEQPDGNAHVYRVERDERVPAVPVLPDFSPSIAEFLPRRPGKDSKSVESD